MRLQRIVSISALVLAPIIAPRAASSQSFNVDIGDTTAVNATPPVSYGAAALQPGFWNFWGNGAAQTIPLTDVAGQATGVTLGWTSGFPGGFAENSTFTSGWDDLLLDDCEDTFQGLPLEYAITGLAPGPYDIYTYSWYPTSSATSSNYYRVSVPLSPDPEQVTGGPWVGGLFQGHTHAKHFVFVSSGQVVTIRVVGTFALVGGLSNGLQIVKRDDALAYCFGDGSGTPCPCANDSPPGSMGGCANSAGTFGILQSTGVASVSADTFVLHGSNMLSTPTSYFQGSAHVVGPNGMGQPLADGLSCVGGSIIRLGTKFSVGGVSQYPDAGETAISIKGMIPPGGGFTRMYQAQYRDSNPTFCTSSTFNRTNAWQVIWAP